MDCRENRQNRIPTKMNHEPCAVQYIERKVILSGVKHKSLEMRKSNFIHDSSEVGFESLK